MFKLFLILMFLIILLKLKKMKWEFFANWSMISYIMLLFSFNNIMFSPSHIIKSFMFDSLSLPLIMLTCWTIFLMFLSSMNILMLQNNKSFFTMLIMLLFILILAFSSMNMMMFYITFEASLIPTVLLIMGWGYQPERLQAGIYLLFYTLFASLPLLIGILILSFKLKTSSMFMMMNLIITNNYLLIICLMAFLVKLPMYLTHLWLPKAHVEAPISGSMILAGVLLKLGGYGMIRLLMIFKSKFYNISEMFITISLLGAFMTSLICLRQIDLKVLIAYSSVGHMGLMVSSIFTNTYWGYNSAISMMIAHGLCSSGMFCLANITYERYNSRSMMMIKGGLNMFPGLSLMWFLLCITNISSPPSLNLLSEIGIIISLLSWSKISMIFISLISFFSAAYTLYMYSSTQHGKISWTSFLEISEREYLISIMHWAPLNMIILKPEIIFFS
uniref:NADH-ubiquinone oxidoreductase chain 4 n=1 Tax=Metaperipatus inae TaxID=444703 RepID=B3F5K3_9BILA|nr:NADH dehydrogenase subunit 4 [Metaperipatus inae]ABQ95561.1 NADH dehydrogenase subunit 4 [Metaperipatus inae]